MSRPSQKDLSLKLMVAFVMILIAGLTNSFACSLQFDDNAQKNMLIAHAVSNADVSLTAASGISITSYGKSFEAGPTASSCPDYVTVSGRVSFTHVKSAVESCSYAMTVSVRTYMGEDFPDGPIETVDFTAEEAACSIKGIRLPKKVILRSKPIRRFPFPR